MSEATNTIVNDYDGPWEVIRTCNCSDDWCSTYIGTAITEARVFGDGVAEVRYVNTETGSECSVIAERWLR